MGEVARDIVDGWMCSNCGTYFELPHGYPVLCTCCWDASEDDLEKLGIQQATEKEV